MNLKVTHQKKKRELRTKILIKRYRKLPKLFSVGHLNMGKMKKRVPVKAITLSCNLPLQATY
jgi:hypothetical protein